MRTYNLPVFNLRCFIYTRMRGTSQDVLPTVPRLESPCNLAYGRRVNAPNPLFNVLVDVSYAVPIVTLLLPRGTDIRSADTRLLLQSNDFVLIADTGARWYVVIGVEDAGLGFPNEHRVAMLLPLLRYRVYPMPPGPLPLPPD